MRRGCGFEGMRGDLPFVFTFSSCYFLVFLGENKKRNKRKDEDDDKNGEE